MNSSRTTRRRLAPMTGWAMALLVATMLTVCLLTAGSPVLASPPDPRTLPSPAPDGTVTDADAPAAPTLTDVRNPRPTPVPVPVAAPAPVAPPAAPTAATTAPATLASVNAAPDADSADAPPTVSGARPAIRPAKPKVVNSMWVDTDLREVLRDISAQTDVTIMADQTVQGIISLSAKNLTVEECLERLCASGNYTFMKVKDYYVVGSIDPGTTMFRKASEMQRIKLRHTAADQLKAMLPQSLAQYVTTDKTTDAVFVAAPDVVAQRVLDAIKLIDVPNQQLAVEAIVFELTEDGSKALGLDWKFQKGKFAAAGNDLVGTITYDASADVATYIDVTLRAIIADHKGQVLANPRILVLNGREAEIFVGQEKYFSLLSGQAVNPYYRLESIKAGVSLKVVPHVGDAGQIVLDLEPEVSDVINDWTRDAGRRGIADDVESISELPVVTRRKAKTSVSIRDGQTVVLGGLLREQHRKLIEKVPGLGDIPGIGAGFRKVREEKEQQEVVILITTHLVETTKVGQNQESGTRLQRSYRSPLDTITVPQNGGTRCEPKPQKPQPFRWPRF